MKNSVKRVLSLLLSMIMVIGLLPMSALAADELLPVDKARKITAFGGFVNSYITPRGTAETELPLPTAIGVTLEDSAETFMLPVTWSCVNDGFDNGEYDPNHTSDDAVFTFEARWDNTAYTAEGLTAPSLQVRFQQQTSGFRLMGETPTPTQTTASDPLAANGLKNSSGDSLAAYDDANPLTGASDTATLEVTPEWLMGQLGNMNGNTFESTNYYGFDSNALSDKKKTITFNFADSVVSDAPKKEGTLSGGSETANYEIALEPWESIAGMRAVGFDAFGRGQDDCVARITAIEGHPDEPTEIHLSAYRQTDSGTMCLNPNPVLLAKLNFSGVEAWQIGAYLSLTAGDFDGDGKDEVAVYLPTGINALYNTDEKAQDAVFPYVVICDLSGNETDGYSFGPKKSWDEKDYLFEPYKLTEMALENSLGELYAVDLATIEQPNDARDDIAMAISPPRRPNDYTPSSATQVVIWRDPSSKSGVYTNKFTMKWDLSNWKTSDNGVEVMMFGGLSAGDMDGDGKTELICIGNRIRHTNTTNWTLDDRWYLAQQFVYDGEQYKARGTTPQGLWLNDEDDVEKKNLHIFDLKEKPETASECITEPLAVECFAGAGRGFAEVVFVEGRVYEWEPTHGYSGPRDITSSSKSPGGYRLLYVMDPGTNYGTIGTGASHRWFSQPVSGNFDMNIYGVEQIGVMHCDEAKDGTVQIRYMVAGQTGFGSMPEWGKTKLADMPLKISKTGVNAGIISSLNPHNVYFLTLIDPNDDASMLTFDNKEVYYTDPLPITVLQAPPYHEELNLVDGNYVSSGSTQFAQISSRSTSLTSSFSVTLGIVVGVEEKLGVFGLAETGFEASTSIYAGAGYENQITNTTEYNTNYKASSVDNVIAQVTPYVRYSYTRTVPAHKAPTGVEVAKLRIEYAAAKGMREAAEYVRWSTSTITKLRCIEDAIRVAYETAKEEVETYGEGGNVNRHDIKITYAIPAKPTVTMLSVDKYNDMVAQLGKEELTITPEMFSSTGKTYQTGDVGSYMSFSDLEGGLISDEKQGLVTAENSSQIGSTDTATDSITQSITRTKENSKAATWQAGVDNEVLIVGAGAKVGVSSSLNYSGAFAEINTTGTSAAGEVALHPKPAGYTDTQAANYNFNFKVGTWTGKVGPYSCAFVGYFVEPITTFPPKMPVNVTVTPKYNATTTAYEGVTVAWDAPSPSSNLTPTGYNVYVNDVKVAAVTDTTKTLQSTQVWPNRVSRISVQSVAGELTSPKTTDVSFFALSKPMNDAVFVNQPIDYTLKSDDHDDKGNLITGYKVPFTFKLKLGELLTLDPAPVFNDTSEWYWESCAPGGEWEKLSIGAAAAYSVTTDGDTGLTTFALSLSVPRSTAGTSYRAHVPFKMSIGGEEKSFELVSQSAKILAPPPPAAQSVSTVASPATPGSGTKLDIGVVVAGEPVYTKLPVKLLEISGDKLTGTVLVAPKATGTVEPVKAVPSGLYQTTCGAVASPVSPVFAAGDSVIMGLFTVRVAVAEGGSGGFRLFGTAPPVNVDTIEFGDSINLSATLYTKDSLAPEGYTTASPSSPTYTAFDETGQDVTTQTIIGSTFTPDSIGKFTITAVSGTNRAQRTVTVIPKSGENRFAVDKLTAILDTPMTIDGVRYGTEKTAAALGLPQTVRIAVDSGMVYNAVVAWDIDAVTGYDPTLQTDHQTFTVDGTVTLPAGVTNTDTIPTTISATVKVNNPELAPFVGTAAGYVYTDPNEQTIPYSAPAPAPSPVKDDPTVETGDGGTATLSEDGTTLTVTPNEGNVVSSVTVNGERVTLPLDNKLTSLKPDDKVVVTFVSEAEWQNPFEDVPADAWYYENVRFANLRGLFGGTADNTFSPLSKMTRAMMWVALSRAAGESTEGEPWYQAGMDWAKKLGVSDGSSPGGNITREQLVVMLFRYALTQKWVDGEKDYPELAGYADAGSVSSFASDAMEWACSVGIINGKENNQLNPNGDANRAEVVAIFERFAEFLRKGDK